MAWNATASQAQFAKYHRRFRRVTTNGVATAENGKAIRIRWVPGTNRTWRAVSSHCRTSTACARPRRNRFMICSTTGGTEKSRKWSKTYFLTCCPRSVERISIGLSPPCGYVMKRMNVTAPIRISGRDEARTRSRPSHDHPRRRRTTSRSSRWARRWFRSALRSQGVDGDRRSGRDDDDEERSHDRHVCEG